MISFRHGTGIVLLALALAGRVPGIRPARGESDSVLSAGISSVLVADLNESEAKVALRAWSRSILKEKGILPEAHTEVAEIGELRRSLQSGRLQFATVSTSEFITLRSSIDFANVFVPISDGLPGEEYVVLVRSDDPATELAGLRGRRFGWHAHSTTLMAMPWLEVELSRAGLPKAVSAFGRVTRHAKISATVLPVYFGSADACLVSRRGFETMGDLNPQVRSRLRVLAKSPRLISSLFFINASFRSDLKDRLVKALQDLHLTPAGRQTLTVFQVDRLEEVKEATFPAETALLSEHARLLKEPEPAEGVGDQGGKASR